jgi:signal peptidase I
MKKNGYLIVEKIYKVNINIKQKIESTVLISDEFFKLIRGYKLGDIITFKDKKYVITGATSIDGIAHARVNERKRIYKDIKKPEKGKILVEGINLNEKTNQLFLKIVDA